MTTVSLASHLIPLVGDTPGSEMKLLAAWDALSVESQMTVLEHLGGRTTPAVGAKAFESPNAYVRYLAVRDLDPLFELLDDEEGQDGNDGTADELQEMIHRIESDPNPLVRYALEEHEDIGEADEFLRQPLALRLARLRGGRSPEGFVRMVRRAVATGVSSDEIEGMVREYLGQSHHLEFAAIETVDGLVSYGISKEFHALWELVPDVPEAIGLILVQRLPGKTKEFEEVPEGVLARLSPELLIALFHRNDVDLVSFRKRIALSHQPSARSDYLIEAAVGRCFDLSDEEFHRLLESDRDRLRRMSQAEDMRPALLKAAEDAFAANGDSWTSLEFCKTRVRIETAQ